VNEELRAITSRDLRQVGDQILRDAVAEVLLLGIAAHVGERQHCDRWLVRHGRCRQARGARCESDAEHAHRPGDVLHRLLAEVLQYDPELVAHRIAHGARDENATWLGQRLKARRDVDAVAVDVVAFDDHVAEVDADAEFDAAVVHRRAVAVGHAGLDGDGAAHRLDGARKVDQQAVARTLDDAAAMRGDMGLDQLAQMRLEEAQRAFLVMAHQPAVAHHVGRQDGREFALGALVFHQCPGDTITPRRLLCEGDGLRVQPESMILGRWIRPPILHSQTQNISTC
jgi:hypothetical protein